MHAGPVQKGWAHLVCWHTGSLGLPPRPGSPLLSRSITGISQLSGRTLNIHERSPWAAAWPWGRVRRHQGTAGSGQGSMHG